VVDRSPDVRPGARALPAVPAPVVGDVVVPDLVGRHVLLEDEERRFRELGLTLTAVDFVAQDGVLSIVWEQVPRGGARAPRGSVVKVRGSSVDFPYTLGVFSGPVWRAHPGCGSYPQPRAQMYGDLVRRVLRRGMSRNRVVSLLGAPQRSTSLRSDWALGRVTYSRADPIDCIYLRVEFDREGRVKRFHQWAS
jgi:hypothetical protein